MNKWEVMHPICLSQWETGANVYKLCVYFQGQKALTFEVWV